MIRQVPCLPCPIAAISSAAILYNRFSRFYSHLCISAHKFLFRASCHSYESRCVRTLLPLEPNSRALFAVLPFFFECRNQGTALTQTRLQVLCGATEHSLHCKQFPRILRYMLIKQRFRCCEKTSRHSIMTVYHTSFAEVAAASPLLSLVWAALRCAWADTCDNKHATIIDNDVFIHDAALGARQFAAARPAANI